MKKKISKSLKEFIQSIQRYSNKIVLTVLIVGGAIAASSTMLDAQIEREWPNTKWYLYTPGDSVDNYFPVPYQPEQPIPFSHKLHAGDMKVPCRYCHPGAYHSASAGVAPMNTCMGCHTYVATDKEPIKYLTEKYKANEPIEWVKVHDLPDFVRFSHKPHTNKGIACQECHGEIEKMPEVNQQAPLQMGWCLRCHVKKDAPIKCLTCHY